MMQKLRISAGSVAPGARRSRGSHGPMIPCGDTPPAHSQRAARPSLCRCFAASWTPSASVAGAARHPRRRALARRPPAPRIPVGLPSPPRLRGLAPLSVGTSPSRSTTHPRTTTSPIPERSSGPGCPTRRTRAIGKDRPVVVMSTIRPGLLGVVPLSSKPHYGDPRWLVIGSGAWDPQRRPSAVRLDFVLAVADKAVAVGLSPRPPPVRRGRGRPPARHGWA